MREEEDQVQSSFSRIEIVRLRARAVRKGVWFRALDRVERGLVDLSIRLVRRVRSLVLVRSLSVVVKKLLDAMESVVARQMRAVGYPLARKLSQIAQSWGNRSAVEWAWDLGFVKFLAISHMDTSGILQC